MVEDAFRQVLSGATYQVVQLPHRWLTMLAQNVDGCAALLIRVSLAPDQIVGDGRGFAVRTERNGQDDYVRISSTEAGVPPVFVKLVEYLLERTELADSGGGAVEALVAAVDEFRRFSARRPGRLSDDQGRGLFAELSFLRSLIGAGAAVDAAINAWKGPFSTDGVGLHDFTFASGRGIEIKSTHQPPRYVRVSSPAQLAPSILPLDLAVLPLEALPVGSESGFLFRDFVVATGEVIKASSPLARDRWESALEALGLDLTDGHYDQWRFQPGEWLRFRVREGFPSIPHGALPDGVVHVTYSLELDRLSPFAEPFSELIAKGVD